jgi:hypothetical protein
MDIVKKIKRLFKKPWTDALAANVCFYPDKIIVQTLDYTDGPCVITNKFTVLAADVSLNILGQTFKKHLNLTEHCQEYHQNNDAWDSYKKAAGFKTNKETYKDARLVSCDQRNNEITITPTENRYNTGYDHRPDLAIKVPLAMCDHELGLQLTMARDLSNG